MLKVQVQAANIQDRRPQAPQGAYRFLAPLGKLFPQVQIVWADKGYTGELGEWMQSHLGWQLQIMQRSVSKLKAKERFYDQVPKRQRQGCSGAALYAGLTLTPSFEVIPRRWVVERTFAWLGRQRRRRQRRLSKDYEYLPSSSENMIYLAMIRLMIKRLARTHLK